MNHVTVIENYVTFQRVLQLTFDENKSIVKENLKGINMTTTNNLKISWKNDFQKSVVEKDVLKLRNKLKTIQNSPEFKMENYRLHMQVREQNM